MHHARGYCRHRRHRHSYYRNVTTTGSSSDGLHTNNPSRRRPTHHHWYPVAESSSSSSLSSLLSTETEPHRHPTVVTVQSSFDWSASSSSKPLCYTRGWAWQTVLLQERLRHKQLLPQVDVVRTEPHHHNDTILFMEHEPVYTLGRGADESHIKDLLRQRTPPPQLPHDDTTTININNNNNNNTILLLQQQEHIERCRQRLSRTNHDRHNSSRLIMESNTYRDFLGRFGNQDPTDSQNDTTTLLQKVDLLCQHHAPKNPVRLPVPMMVHHHHHDNSPNGSSYHETNRSSTTTTMIPIYRVERGGQVTYHGPGQLIMYPLWDLTFWKKDLRWFVHQMEQVVIDATRELLTVPPDDDPPQGVIVGRDATHTGVWITTTNGHHPTIVTKKRKIAAIGISASRWITSHGICYNIHPNLQHYDAIVPCGIPSHNNAALDTENDTDDESSPKSEVEYGVTSLQELRQEQWSSSSSSHSVSPPPLTMSHVASVVLKHLQRIFQIHRVQWGERIR